jgi:adenylyltransferase/sulfurtransferase
MKDIPEMTVTELKELLDRQGEKILLLDVRTPDEYEIAKLPGSLLIPLAEIEDGEGIEKLKAELNGHRLIVHCKVGARSAKALTILKQAGIEGTNVRGGIAAWSRQVDSSVPQY